MKKTFKTIIIMILCTIITVTGISAETAYAADNTLIKVTFNKKSVKLKIDGEKGIKRVKLNTLKDKWGTPEVYKDEYMERYSWKKGKTEIYYADDLTDPERSLISINADDKNAAICGIKVGMKKAKAVKIMKKLGAENPESNYIGAEFASRRVIIFCDFKKGKVSRISCTAYAEDRSE